MIGEEAVRLAILDVIRKMGPPDVNSRNACDEEAVAAISAYLAALKEAGYALTQEAALDREFAAFMRLLEEPPGAMMAHITSSKAFAVAVRGILRAAAAWMRENTDAPPELKG